MATKPPISGQLTEVDEPTELDHAADATQLLWGGAAGGRAAAPSAAPRVSDVAPREPDSDVASADLARSPAPRATSVSQTDRQRRRRAAPSSRRVRRAIVWGACALVGGIVGAAAGLTFARPVALPLAAGRQLEHRGWAVRLDALEHPAPGQLQLLLTLRGPPVAGGEIRARLGEQAPVFWSTARCGQRCSRLALSFGALGAAPAPLRLWLRDGRPLTIAVGGAKGRP